MTRRRRRGLVVDTAVVAGVAVLLTLFWTSGAAAGLAEWLGEWMASQTPFGSTQAP